MKFSMKDFFSKCENPQKTADLVTFTEKILNGKTHFSCSDSPTQSHVISLKLNAI